MVLPPELWVQAALGISPEAIVPNLASSASQSQVAQQPNQEQYDPLRLAQLIAAANPLALSQNASGLTPSNQVSEDAIASLVGWTPYFQAQTPPAGTRDAPTTEPETPSKAMNELLASLTSQWQADRSGGNGF